MLVSHSRKFIFQKSAKTASSSVESYFERFCMPEGEWQPSIGRPEYVSEVGIIGNNCGNNVRGSKWYNHMAAGTVKKYLGDEKWNAYFKFTTIRNPFDKMVSGFYFFEGGKNTYSLKIRIKALLKQILGLKGFIIYGVQGNTDVERFRSWVKKGGYVHDRDTYTIDGALCLDYYMRYEKLEEEIRHVCEHLSIPFEPSHIPRFKSGIRKSGIPVRDYYDAATEKMVRDMYRFEFEHFGYEMPE